MRMLLIRHAESSGQPPQSPLTAKGKQDARALAQTLRDLGAGPLYSSPYTRACQTIEPYAKLTAQSVRMIEGFRERLLSPVKRPDWKEQMQRSFEDPNHACEGGESLSEVRSRAAAELIQIERFAKGLPTITSHGGLMSSLLHAADPSFGFDGWQSLGNPDVFDVEIETGRVTAFTRIPLKETT